MKKIDNAEKVVSLARYYTWAKAMRLTNEFYLKQTRELVKSDAELQKQPMFFYSYLMTQPYLSYWFSSMYVVIEGWDEIKLSYAKIDSLLAPPTGYTSHPYKDLLRRYRNGAFHYQKDFFDSRFVDLMKTNKNTEVNGIDILSWVIKLDEAFNDFFFNELGVTI